MNSSYTNVEFVGTKLFVTYDMCRQLLLIVNFVGKFYIFCRPNFHLSTVRPLSSSTIPVLVGNHWIFWIETHYNTLSYYVVHSARIEFQCIIKLYAFEGNSISISIIHVCKHYDIICILHAFIRNHLCTPFKNILSCPNEAHFKL